MMTRLLFVVALAVLSLCFDRRQCSAAFFLTGAQIYQSSATGSISSDDSYRYSTNDLDTAAARLSVKNGLTGTPMDRAISFELLTGQTTTFYFSVTTDNLPAATGSQRFVGMNLFFEDPPAPDIKSDQIANNTYNPARGITAPGNLTVFSALESNTFGFVEAGVAVQNYDYVENAAKPLANGLHDFMYNGYTVSVTSFSVSTNPAYKLGAGAYGGSFKLTVTATPEPSTIGIGALACCGLAGWVKKRRGKKKLVGGK